MTNVWGRYAFVLLLSSICLVGIGAEKTSKRTTKTSTKSASAEKPEGISGRLPRYFASLVDKEQRVEIYEIQASYLKKIADLEKELAALEAAQLKEIEKVLTTTQRKELTTMRGGKLSKSAAKSKTSSRSSKSTKAKPASTKSKSSSKRRSPSKSTSSKSKSKASK